jgi:hypothetical protein
MARIDRREKLALDAAYRFFRAVVKDQRSPDLFTLANSLKTISNALRAPQNGEFKLTIRLWERIEETLFDKLFGAFPTHVILLSEVGQVIPGGQPIPDDATVEVHPHGLRRSDDVFSIAIKNLHPLTQLRLRKVWKEKGGTTKPEDFQTVDCGEVCQPKGFIVGEAVLLNESELGKQRAYQRWWELYWQAYCSNDKQERLAIEKEMSQLEGIWGDLYY